MRSRFVRAAAPPLVVFAVVGAVFAALRPGIARSTLGSPRALLITAAVLALAVGMTYVVLRASRRIWPATAAGLLPVVAFLAYTIAPTYRDVEVNDASAVLPAEQTATPTGTPATGPDASKSTAPARPPAAAPKPQPQVLGRGALAGVNHRAAGTAYLVRDPVTGALSVVLAKLDVEPGPDYEVHLVPGRGTTRPTGVRLAHLKGNRGNQTYPVPAGTPTGGPLSVLIWCRAFAVPIAVAPLG